MIISDCMLVPVEHDIDITSAPALRRHLDRLVGGGCRRIILDLAKVNFIDSTGMALILASSRALRQRGGLLSLVNVSPAVMHGFAVGQLLHFIPCTPPQAARGKMAPLPSGATPEWRLTLRITRDGLTEARGRLSEMLALLPLDADQVFDIVLAAGEAMGNCVSHTPSAMGFLTVAAYDDRVVIEAADDGPGFSLAADEEPETTLLHGRGIKIMRLLCDSVEIERRPGGKGTIARLVKLFDGPGHEKGPTLSEVLSA